MYMRRDIVYLIKFDVGSFNGLYKKFNLKQIEEH